MKVGILYDNISRNIGDLAIGISVKKILNQIGIKKNDIEEMIPGISNPYRFNHIIIGGGLLIREKGDFFYDKFRLRGPYILNAVGIHNYPNDLDYLNDYLYITVRSTGDKDKISYLKKNIEVIPDTTLLLEDIKINLKIKRPAIGIHCTKITDINEESVFNNFIKNLSKYFYIYLLPITHYNYDFEFLGRIKTFHINNNRIIYLPPLSPLEIFTIIGKFDYFISHSLHGAYFAYAHNVPFLLKDFENDKKMRFFMQDRSLNEFLFSNLYEIENKFEKLIKRKIDYSIVLIKDYEKLKEHIYRIKNILKIKKKYSFFKQNFYNYNNVKEKSYLIINEYINLLSKIEKNNKKNVLFKKILTENKNLIKENQYLKQSLQKITSSKTYKIWQGYCRIRDKILNKLKIKKQNAK